MKTKFNKLAKRTKDESGQAFILVLILLAVGSLILAPLLSYMGTGLNAGKINEEKAEDFFAADSGVEDGIWQIKYDHLDEKFTSPPYDQYDYDIYGTSYAYPAPLSINDRDVNVTITNIWIPKDINPVLYGLSKSDLQTIIEGSGGQNPELMVSGTLLDIGTYEIRIDYYPESGDEMRVSDIGVWLPPGYSYVEGSSNLEENPLFIYYPSSVDITGYAGGQAVVWHYASPGILFRDLPEVNYAMTPQTAKITFDFNGPLGGVPDALAWMVTSDASVNIDSPFAWDADVKVYKIESTAGSTYIEAYLVRSELRQLSGAFSGDYFATGNTLMTPTDNYRVRDRLYRESSATIAEDDIPSNADIGLAYLYWSGWIEEGAEGVSIWSDPCSSFNNWNNGLDWAISYGRFRGHHADGNGEDDRYLTMNSGVVDLSPYYGLGQTVTLSWQQSEDGDLEDLDRLYFELSADGNFPGSGLIEAFRSDIGGSPVSFSYEIPNEYLTSNFRMRFYLYGFEGSGGKGGMGGGTEYCYIDNITISTSGTVVEDAKVDSVMFNGTQVTADDWQVEPTEDSGYPDSWSYSCFYDATDLVEQWIDDETLGSNGSGTYTLGHVLEGTGYNLYPTGQTAYPLATPGTSEWAYAGWSLILVYTSPGTEGHQLYLFDTFYYVGLNTTLTFPISGFLVPDNPEGSHLTYFVGEGDNHYVDDYIKVNNNYLSDAINPWNNVFNSYSNAIDDPYLSGVDIDTYDISAYVNPGDTSAEIVLDNGNEIYNLVYIIVSFRSETTTGGTVTYIIH